MNTKLLPMRLSSLAPLFAIAGLLVGCSRPAILNEAAGKDSAINRSKRTADAASQRAQDTNTAGQPRPVETAAAPQPQAAPEKPAD